MGIRPPGSPERLGITSFNIPGMTSAEAAETIARAVRELPGVAEVTVNLPARIVQVDYDDESTTPQALKDAIEGAGYLVQRYSDGKR